MAISIEESTGDLAPVYNEMNYLVSSDNTAEDGFKYIVDFYVDAVKVARRRVSPEPINSRLVIDVASILENFITSHAGFYEGTDDGIFSGAAQCKDFTIKFGEEYLVAGVRTQYVDLATSVSRAWDASLSYNEWINYPGEYANIILTNKPAAAYVTDLYGSGISTVNIASGDTLNDVTITTFLGGVLQNTYVIPNTLGALTSYNFATGVDTINAINPTKITGTPTQPIIDASIDAYIVTTNPNLGASDSLIIAIEDRCEEQESARLHFLNELGGYDTFDFTLLGTKSANIERKTMRRAVSRINSDGDLIKSTADRGRTNYNTTYTHSETLSSNWITEEVSEWLVEMLSSPRVVLELDGVFTSVIIEDSRYDYKTEQQDELFKIDVNISYSLKEVRQRG